MTYFAVLAIEAGDGTDDLGVANELYDALAHHPRLSVQDIAVYDSYDALQKDDLYGDRGARQQYLSSIHRMEEEVGP